MSFFFFFFFFPLPILPYQKNKEVLDLIEGQWEGRKYGEEKQTTIYSGTKINESSLF